MIDYQAAVMECETLLDMVRWAMSRFEEAGIWYGHGTDNPWDEAMILVCFGLHLPMDLQPAILQAKLTRAERQGLVELIRRRVSDRIPLAYLTQQATFAGMDFYVDERVLIPRSPVSEFIEVEFAPWLDPHDTNNILDLCTGSGCIAIAAAHYCQGASVDAVDISPDALQVAEKNVAAWHMEDRVRCLQGDLFSPCDDARYDVIVSNPPYVPEGDIADFPPEYHHEPHALALAAGEDGLEIVDKILAQAADHLTPQGILILEVGLVADALQARYPDVPFVWLDCARGGEGVLLLTAELLQEHFAE